MSQVAQRKPIAVAIEMFTRDDVVTLTLRHGERQTAYRPVGKDWRTLRRGDLVRGPEGSEFRVRRLTLREAEPPLADPVEIESVVSWAATGLRR